MQISKLSSVRIPTLGQIPPLWRVFFIILFISPIVRGRVCNLSSFTDVMKHCTGCYHFADLFWCQSHLSMQNVKAPL